MQNFIYEIFLFDFYTLNEAQQLAMCITHIYIISPSNLTVFFIIGKLNTHKIKDLNLLEIGVGVL